MGKVVSALSVAVAAVALLAPCAHATLPGTNGRILFVENPYGSSAAVSTINPDGTNRTQVLQKFFSNGVHPVFSPDRQRIAGWFDGDIYLFDPDGSHLSNIQGYSWPSWSPDGTRIAFETGSGIATMSMYGQDPVDVTDWAFQPSWSPDGKQVAYVGGVPGDPGNFEVFKVNIDGTGKTQLSHTPGPSSVQEVFPDWSPDGTKIAYTYGDSIWTMESDGTNPQRITPGTEPDDWPAWSPDGTKIAFSRRTYHAQLCPEWYCEVSAMDIMTMNPDGSDVQNVTNTIETNSEVQPSWESIRPPSPPGYARPKGATPMRLSLVPAFTDCTSPNREHGPPLAFDSCSPPQLYSGTLTVGTPDATGTPAESVGFLKMDAIAGNPSTPADEADVTMQFQITDVRKRSDFGDYAGELGITMPFQLTDRLSSTGFTSSTAGTVQGDIPITATVPCAATADPGTGGTCALATAAGGLVPGGVPEGGRSIWQLGAIVVTDGGTDGDADTAPNSPFAKPGVFVP